MITSAGQTSAAAAAVAFGVASNHPSTSAVLDVEQFQSLQASAHAPRSLLDTQTFATPSSPSLASASTASASTAYSFDQTSGLPSQMGPDEDYFYHQLNAKQLHQSQQLPRYGAAAGGGHIPISVLQSAATSAASPSSMGGANTGAPVPPSGSNSASFGGMTAADGRSYMSSSHPYNPASQQALQMPLSMATNQQQHPASVSSSAPFDNSQMLQQQYARQLQLERLQLIRERERDEQLLIQQQHQQQQQQHQHHQQLQQKQLLARDLALAEMEEAAMLRRYGNASSVHLGAGGVEGNGNPSKLVQSSFDSFPDTLPSGQGGAAIAAEDQYLQENFYQREIREQQLLQRQAMQRAGIRWGNDRYDEIIDGGYGGQLQNFQSLGALYPGGYSPVPPPGYLCKLCFVEGHWMKNCALYREKRRDPSPAYAINPLTGRPFLISGSGSAVKYLQNSLGSSYYDLGVGMRISTPPDGYVCRKCNTPGHWIQQCSYKNNNPPPDTYVCKICSVRGHWIWACPQRMNTTRLPYY